MIDLNDPGTRICLDFVYEAKRRLTDLLYHHRALEEGLGRAQEQKDVDHTQYGFDVAANELLYCRLREAGINARVFSEENEAGWEQVGTGAEYLIVSDPFDQSTTTMWTFRMASVAICVTDEKCQFRACAIGDLNTHMAYFADRSNAWQIVLDPRLPLSKEELAPQALRPSSIERLSAAVIVLPAMKGKRSGPARRSSITAAAGKWLNVDGGLNLARVAAGYIDAYLDPFVGQPISEVVYAELVRRAGGIVTDTSGRPFDVAEQMQTLLCDHDRRYGIIAASTKSLSAEIQRCLEHDRRAGLAPLP